MMKTFVLVSALILSTIGVQAQKIGAFNDTLLFAGNNRIVSCIVPTSYSPSTPHKLWVGLHGLGDNSTNYRNAFASVSNLHDYFPETIFVFPDGGNDQNRDFYQPNGDEAFILDAINHIKALYNIDTNYVVLQGFSLGGRAALQFGLDNRPLFKGLILNTPAVQGVKEAKIPNGFSWANAAGLPIVITLGNQDDLYFPPIDTTAKQLASHGAKYTYYVFSGGHTIPNFANTDYYAYFDNPENPNPDASLVGINIAPRMCNNSLYGTVVIQNKSAQVVDSIQLKLDVNNTTTYQKYYMTLQPWDTAIVMINAYTHNGTNQNVDVTVGIDWVNGDPDTYTSQNNITKTVHFQPQVLPVPYEERFIGSKYADEWAFESNGDLIYPLSVYDGDEALWSGNSIFVFNNAGEVQSALTPNLDFSTLNQAFLQFSTDYNYVHYSQNVLGIDTNFMDTLEVLYSTDCGQTYQSLFKKWGKDLNGNINPIQDPLDMNFMYVSNDTTLYLNHQIDVSHLKGNSNVHFKFSYISALGGYIYIDNIKVAEQPNSIVDDYKANVKLYPNPVKGHLTIELPELGIHYAIKDVTGRIVKQGIATDLTVQINAGDWQAGQYYFEYTAASGIKNFIPFVCAN